MGTGNGSPSRRATVAATASTADESRPPEKLTRHGSRCSAASIARSNATRGVVPELTEAMPECSRWHREAAAT